MITYHTENVAAWKLTRKMLPILHFAYGFWMCCCLRYGMQSEYGQTAGRQSNSAHISPVSSLRQPKTNRSYQTLESRWFRLTTFRWNDAFHWSGEAICPVAYIVHGSLVAIYSAHFFDDAFTKSYVSCVTSASFLFQKPKRCGEQRFLVNPRRPFVRWRKNHGWHLIESPISVSVPFYH